MTIALQVRLNQIGINEFATFVACASNADNSSHQSNFICKDRLSCEIVYTLYTEWLLKFLGRIREI